MMNTQALGSIRHTADRVVPASPVTLRPGRVLDLGSTGGRLDVLHGRVWLTRAGDRDDHVVERGRSLLVPPSGRALVEALDDERPALVVWRPRTLAERIGAALLHNSAAPEARQVADGRSIPRGHRADAAAELRNRARSATQEARCGAAGAA
jgi:DUF2917 family protein